MTDKLNEQISALLDNELSEHETDSVLSRLGHDHALRRKWDRYHLIGDAMRGEAINGNAGDISERVRSMLEQEPAIIAISRKKRTGGWQSNWIKSAAGAALAASVAAVAILTTPGLLETNAPTQPALTAANTKNTPSANLVATGIQTVGVQQIAPTTPVVQPLVPGTRWKNLTEPSVENRLNGYLVDHSEYVAPGAGMGVMPYATFVGYDSKQR